LLHVCQKLAARLELSLIVAHLNHQLRPAAQADEDFVRELAKRWQLPIFVEAQNVSRFAQENKHSLEEAARYCRYDFLGRVAAETAAHKVAVGHNADDQVETVLMHFLRGAGLTGLRGMLPGVALSHLNSGQTVTAPHLIRPLLETSRSDIEGYCQRHQLSPRQDDSNLDPTYFRNRLRHELIPYLETYNPNIRQVLQRTAKVVAAEVETLDGLVDQVWPGVIKDSSAESLVFAIEVWLALPLALKRATLRRASYTLQKHLRDLSFDHIERAITLIERRQSGRQATLPQGLRLIVSYDSFVLTKAETSLAPAGLNQPYLATPEMLALTVPGLTPLPQTAWQLRAENIPTTTIPAPAEQANPR
jgi:tRNA(Ile)-lysidine synthase